MDGLSIALLIIALLTGVAFFVAKSRSDQRIVGLQQKIQSLNIENTRLSAEKDAIEREAKERGEWVEKSMAEFKSISADVLSEQRKSFMDTAKETFEQREKAVEQMVKPLAEKIDTLDKSRAESAAALKEQIELLANQTSSLSSALSKPEFRGSWGEMQVERALEFAGLQKGLHYTTQDSDGKGGRTDFVVHLPHDRDIILDSKVALSALQEASEAKEDDLREEKLIAHADQMWRHASDLGSKEYWSSLPKAADFVVMVVPEFALSPAVEQRPTLIEDALNRKVVITTHSTLVALLKCVALGWRERDIANNANKVLQEGQELQKRLVTFSEYLGDIGKGLSRAVSEYNKSVGSFDARLLPQARRFSEMSVNTADDLPELDQVDPSIRSLQ